MKTKKHSLKYLLLLPLLAVVLFQGILTFVMLLSSGVKSTMEQNAVDLDSYMVENRKVVLENAMIDQWSAVRKESTFLGLALQGILDEREADLETFLADRSLQRDYLQGVFPELLETLRRDPSSGVFLILANDGAVDKAEQYAGFFLRDSDPAAATETDSDLLLERGDKNLARRAGITLDSSWMPEFALEGNGVRSADDFFYRPYMAALEHPDVDMTKLGYWAEPFILEDHKMDDHRMITYSLPLIHDGVIYGILGTEVSASYLINSYFDVRELNRDQNAGYALTIRQKDGSYRGILGKGMLYDAAIRKNGIFSLEQTRHQDLFEVNDTVIGSQKVYALTAPLKLYGNHIPYDNTEWVLCGFVAENSIFSLGNQLYRSLFTTILACAVVGMAVMVAVSRYVSGPVFHLVDSVRGGLSGLKSFVPSGIREVDELHRVVENLTENELHTELQLKEEKERYQVAVESSSDIFFTYRETEQTIELVNSPLYSGLWNVEQFIKKLVIPCFSKEDQADFLGLFQKRASRFQIQLLFSDPAAKEARWIEIHGNAMVDEGSKARRVVGYVRDIHEIKMRELEQKRKQILDPVTMLYRLKDGLEILTQQRVYQPNGTLVLMDVQDFSVITQNYGLTFGDVLLEEFARILEELCKKNPKQQNVLIRAGSDEFLLWLSGVRETETKRILKELAERFASLTRNDLDLCFHAGACFGGYSDATALLLKHVKQAAAEAELQDSLVLFWTEAAHFNGKEKKLGRVVSAGYVEQMGLASLALSLFDRSSSLAAALDLLALRLERHFGLTNLLLTTFHSDFQVNSLDYQWKKIREKKENQVVHCTVEQLSELKDSILINNPISLERAQKLIPILPEKLRMCEGIVLPLCDNGQYSGSLFLLGISTELFEKEENSKLLWEITTVIQNRINRDHHDQSAKAKSNFLAHMSHEIRTPMNGIIGMTEIALKEGQTEENRIACLQKVKSSSNYLLNLLNDILDMAKIESGKMRLLKAGFDLQQLLHNLHAILDARFEEKEQRFVTDIQLNHTWFYGDSVRISQVLINLLGNAVKYSGNGTTVTLTVREELEMGNTAGLYFAVKDEGIGISEEDRYRIFQSFEQIDRSAVKQQGTGLGLAISNQLVRMMGSSIVLESEVGKGSTFSFRIVLELAGPEKEQDETSEKTAISLGHYAGMRILVAEDNELNMEIIRYILEDFGFEVDGAENGKVALERFQESPEGSYSLIFMDIMMPVMNGLEAAHAIRQTNRTDGQTIPIIAVSANAFEEDIQSSIASGMNAHLSKPIEVEKLKETLYRILG